MFTMTGRQIKDELRRRKRAGLRPGTMAELATMRGVSRALISMAVKRPRRYPGVRRWIESLLRTEKAA